MTHELEIDRIYKDVLVSTCGGERLPSEDEELRALREWETGKVKGTQCNPGSLRMVDMLRCLI